MSTVSDIIGAWPSRADCAEDVGVSEKLIVSWVDRDRIPAGYWRSLVSAAKRRGLDGVTYDRLARLYEQNLKRKPTTEEAA